MKEYYLGIDPGTTTVGYAIISSDGRGFELVDYGVILTNKHRNPGERLKTIHDRLDELLTVYRPQAAAIEKLYFSRNVTTAIAVGEARGVLLYTLAERAIPVFSINPMAVKKNVVGSGAATKKQVQQMVKTILGLAEIPQPDDAADALAIAISGLRLAPWQRAAEESRT
ncbi:MAG TPA: crossover junction endodeoxyribonuclease RuvC [bacterium]|nr:crossover junction endodeoxyribonuclease RuvC [bacterium]